MSFNVIGKKDNQSSVSNQDRSTDNAGTSCPPLSVCPCVGMSRFAPEFDDRFKLSLYVDRKYSFELMEIHLFHIVIKHFVALWIVSTDFVFHK